MTYMKKDILSLSASVLFSLSVAVFGLASCSDKVYEDINTDKTKAETMNPSFQLAFAEKQIFGDMTYVDVHRLYTYAFTQHLMGCWNTTYYGGMHRVDDNEMSRPWNNLYPGAFRNLTDGLANVKGDSTQVNLYAALSIFRVYVGSLLTDYYGDIPYSEAGLNHLEGITQPKYDKQEDIYKSFFADLKAAVALFDAQAKPIDSDPMFNGNIDHWKVFANSLRLRYAMRLSGIYEKDPGSEIAQLAKNEFIDALSAGVMNSSADDACVKHEKISYSFGQESYKDFRGNALSKYFYGNDPANNPTYICETFWKQLYDNNDPRTTLLCRFYIDDYMSISTGEGRIDITDSIVATQKANEDKGVISPVKTGDYSYDPWPQYGQASIAGSPLMAQLAEIKTLHSDYVPEKNPRWMRPKLAVNLLRSENPGVLMTYAEVCFLRAEAAVLGWTADNAKSMYEAGIRAAMDFLTTNYDYDPILDGDYAAYIAQPAIAFSAGTAQQLSQINTQAWILHFHNPAEAWANQRRADAPVLAIPASDRVMDGNTATPVRLCYPLKEETYNGAEYEEAKSRVAGGYNWHARVWWDVK